MQREVKALNFPQVEVLLFQNIFTEISFKKLSVFEKVIQLTICLCSLREI